VSLALTMMPLEELLKKLFSILFEATFKRECTMPLLCAFTRRRKRTSIGRGG